MTTSTSAVRSEQGFTLIELMIASALTLVVMGVAFSTFKNAEDFNQSILSLADSTQNLRAGTNQLVRDLMQAGRDIDIGGISIPSGSGSTGIYRPSPDGKSYFFDNTTATTLSSITTGASLGPTIDGQSTDMVTMLMADPYLADLIVYPDGTGGGVPTLDSTGASMDVGTSTSWLEGDPDNGIPAVKTGDLFYFIHSNGSWSTIQTVTGVDGSVVHFDTGDPFNFNQPDAEAGNITQLLGATLTVRRIYMYTYYVQDDDGVPRLMRQLNMFPATALAGVVEDLDLSYDLADGVTNPVNVGDLPYTSGGVTYTANQIRKVNVHVGVRSEDKSTRTNDYLRNHVSTVISIRNLAYTDRYN
ncbi:MAG TPA: prepilin-type N-terminal cleavage/methylation domain-containing protein [Vicinamibacterales bacterium]|nr:prepilin-type N-terminal cleavage/methylation domain-containing protein [Vicinamibacterales bacterium]